MAMTKLDRNNNLDTLKAISIVLVLIWHLQPFKFVSDKSIFHRFPQYFVYVFESNVTLIAVPMFYLVSIYLFLLRIGSKPDYLLARIRRVGPVFIFWGSVQSLIFVILINYSSLKFPQTDLTFADILLFIASGGPPLPIVGGSVFYFLFNLILLIIVSAIYIKRASIKLSFIIIVMLNAYFLISNIFSIYVPYWRIDNFLIYIPLAHLLVRSNRIVSGRISVLLASVVLLLFIIFEYGLNYFTRASFPAYFRNSIFFGVVTLYAFIHQLNIRNPNRVIILLSRYSLGLFALHKYWQLFFHVYISKLFITLNFARMIDIVGVNFDVLQFFIAFTAILGSCASVYFLQFIPYARRYIM